MDGSKRPARTGRYVPFNLSSLAPFESTAAALNELPLLHSISPAPTTVETNEEIINAQRGNHASPNRTVAKSMLNMMVDTAVHSSWTFSPEELSVSNLDAPAWVAKTCHDFQRMATSDVVNRSGQASRKQPTKRPRSGGTSPTPAMSSRSTPRRAARGRKIADSDTEYEPDPESYSRIENEQVNGGEDEATQFTRERKVAHERAQFEDENFTCFLDFLGDFAQRIETEENKLRATESESLMAQLRENVSIHSKNLVLHRVPANVLSSLMSGLIIRIRHARMHITESRSNNSPIKGPVVSQATIAAHCVSTILMVYGAPKMPSTILLDDYLEEIAAFMGCLSSNIIYPVFGLTKNSAAEDGTSKPLGKTSRAIQKLVSIVCTIYEDLLALVSRRVLSEELVLQILSKGIGCLRIPDVGVLHTSFIRLAGTVYTHYPSLEVAVLNFLLDEIAYLPNNRRQLRFFRVSGSTTSNIRVSSAMALQIIQAAAANRNGGENITNETGVSQCLDGCNRANLFAVNVANRILTRVLHEKDAEYRAAVQALLDDMMSLYIEPEWPGSSLFLRRFCFVVVSMVEGETTSKSQKKTKLNAHGRGLAVDYLGKVCACLSNIFGSHLLSQYSKGEKEEERTEKNAENRVALLHFITGDSDDLDNNLNIYKISPDVALWLALFAIEDVHPPRKDDDVEDKKSEDESSDEAEEETEKETAEEEDRNKFAQDQFQVMLQALAESKRMNDPPNRKDAFNSVKYILGNSGLCRDFRRILDSILFCFQDSTPTVRAKAVRVLSALAFDRRFVLQCLPSTVQAIENCCRDVSTLVRDAALDFVGGFLTFEEDSNGDDNTSDHDQFESNDSEYFNLFQSVLSLVDKRLKDSAVLVRKRAINIFHKLAVEILSHKDSISDGTTFETLNPKEELIVFICASLVGRLDDPEKSVRTVAERTIRFALFAIESDGKVKKFGTGSDEYASRSARRVIAVFKRLSATSQTNLFSRILSKEMVAANNKVFVTIIRTIMEAFYDLESNSNQTEKNANDDPYRVACSAVLFSFCTLDPSLIAPHITTLALQVTDVKPRTQSDVISVGRILRLLERGLPCVDNLEESFFDRTLTDVETIVCQVPTPELEEPAIRCLCAIALSANTPESQDLLSSTAGTFLDFIVDQEKSLIDLSKGIQSQYSAVLERNARGALVRLSLLMRFGEFEDEFIKTVYEVLKRICDGMLEAWSLCNTLSSGSPILLRASVRALMNFLIRHRHCLPSGTHTIIACSSTALKRMNHFGDQDRDSIEILLQVLMGFHEMMRNEEERNSDPLADRRELIPDNNTNNNEGESGKNVALAAEDDAEAGHLAVCAQSLLPSLANASSSFNLNVRRCVVNIFGLLIRQGLVLPANIVSPLFALLADADMKIREDALRVITFIAERYSGMLASAFLPAIRYLFQNICARQADNENDDPMQELINAVVDPKTGLAYLSSVLVSLNRDTRLGILECLLREFDPNVVMKPNMKKNDSGELVEDPSGALNLHGNKKTEPISKIVFISILVSHLDYSLGTNASGGSAAAENKLKAGRMEIGEICDIATRIISNSGQAVYRVAAQRLKVPSYFTDHGEVAEHATRLSLLLHLKKHLLWLRTIGIQAGTNEVNEMENNSFKRKEYSLKGIHVTGGSVSKDELFAESTEQDWTRQMKGFRAMMKDDTVFVNEDKNGTHGDNNEEVRANGTSGSKSVRKRGRKSGKRGGIQKDKNYVPKSQKFRR